jgi:hypothetical protein
MMSICLLVGQSRSRPVIHTDGRKNRQPPKAKPARRAAVGRRKAVLEVADRADARVNAKLRHASAAVAVRIVDGRGKAEAPPRKRGRRLPRREETAVETGVCVARPKGEDPVVLSGTSRSSSICFARPRVETELTRAHLDVLEMLGDHTSASSMQPASECGGGVVARRFRDTFVEVCNEQ